MSGVFVIINEWIDTTNMGGAEVAGGTYFESETEAWQALREIAHTFELDIDYEDTSIQLEDHAPHLQSEEYYIQELTKG